METAHQSTLVECFGVVYLSNALVNIEGDPLLECPLFRQRKGDVRGAWDGLIRDFDFLRGPA